MTNIKLYYCPSKAGNGILYYRITHNTTQRRINSGIRISPKYWDFTRESLISPTPTHLAHIQQQIFRDVARLEQIAEHFERQHTTFRASDIAEYFKCSAGYHSFTEFAEEIIEQLRQNGHLRTCETYTATVKCFNRFRKYTMLEDISSELLLSFEAWMRKRGLTMNTCSFYMRILRAIYNRAIERGFIAYNNPFRHVYTGVDKTIKRAISLQSLRRIKSLDLSSKPALELARDMFLFSFYTRGMSFVDIAFLRKSNLCHGVLQYRRRKTNQQLLVRWERCMQDIVERYNIPSSPYLLPLITDEKNARAQYLNASRKINHHLKLLGEMLGLPIPLTMYVARHSWASIARDKRIPLSIISESMGHDSELTTRIYLSSIDHHEIDRANRTILRLI